MLLLIEKSTKAPSSELADHKLLILLLLLTKRMTWKHKSVLVKSRKSTQYSTQTNWLLRISYLSKRKTHLQIQRLILWISQFWGHKILGWSIPPSNKSIFSFIKIRMNENVLESDHSKRQDLQLLKQRKIEEAQKAKEMLE